MVRPQPAYRPRKQPCHPVDWAGMSLARGMTVARHNLRFLVMASLVGVAVGQATAAEASGAGPHVVAETKATMRLLVQAHFQGGMIMPSDLAGAIPDFMAQLDPFHLYFLERDRTGLEERFGKDLFEKLSEEGSLAAAEAIGAIYKERVAQRSAWVQAEAEKAPDFTATEYWPADADRSAWPADEAGADRIWRSRVKSELLDEVLNGKTEREAGRIVHARYEAANRRLAQLDSATLAEGFLGCVAKLYDPHSTYFAPTTVERARTPVAFGTVGLGLLLGEAPDGCCVNEIVAGGPAAKGGQIQRDDCIVAIAEEGGRAVELTGLPLAKITELTRGPVGSRVVLTIRPVTATDPATRKQVTLTRGGVPLDPYRSQAAMFKVPVGPDRSLSIGVVTMPAFHGALQGIQGTTTQEVARALEKFQPLHLQGLILDLRHNGGGLLDEVVDLTSLFIGNGPVVLLKDRAGAIRALRAGRPAAVYGGPLVVLVDHYTGAGAEIIAGTLKDYGRAIVVGAGATWGNGTAQTVVDLRQIEGTQDKAGMVKLTVQKFYLPGGASVQLRGIVPDILVPALEQGVVAGEAGLRHAVAWDEIPGSVIEGAPLKSDFLKNLREASERRQTDRAEFTILMKGRDWQIRRAKQPVSLNLEERRRQRAEDEAFLRELDAEFARLAPAEYAMTQVPLGPTGAGERAPGDTQANTAGNRKERPDIGLQEALRVTGDAILAGWRADPGK